MKGDKGTFFLDADKFLRTKFSTFQKKQVDKEIV